MLLSYRLEKEDHRKVIGILTGQCPLNKQLFDIGVSGNRQPSVKEMHEDIKNEAARSHRMKCVGRSMGKHRPINITLGNI